MNETQREQIQTLRLQGLGYKAIAKAVGVSRDSVRQFCKNHHLLGYGAAIREAAQSTAPVRYCAYCGQPFHARDKHVYCCHACYIRDRFWREEEGREPYRKDEHCHY